VKPHQGKDGEWQQVEIVARGNTLVHILNGQVASVTIDDNPISCGRHPVLQLRAWGRSGIGMYVKVLN
jgi:hypothetical protein